MNELVVNVETATDEVNRWLDAKRISISRRQSQEFAPFIANLVEAVSEGHLTLAENNEWNHKLIVPIEDENGSVVKSSITYKFRLNDNDKKKHRRSVTKDDSVFLLTALALTNEARGIVEGLDSSTDKIILDAITVFFI